MAYCPKCGTKVVKERGALLKFCRRCGPIGKILASVASNIPPSLAKGTCQ